MSAWSIEDALHRIEEYAALLAFLNEHAASGSGEDLGRAAFNGAYELCHEMQALARSVFDTLDGRALNLELVEEAEDDDEDEGYGFVVDVGTSRQDGEKEKEDDNGEGKDEDETLDAKQAIALAVERLKNVTTDFEAAIARLRAEK